MTDVIQKTEPSRKPNWLPHIALGAAVAGVLGLTVWMGSREDEPVDASGDDMRNAWQAHAEAEHEVQQVGAQALRDQQAAAGDAAVADAREGDLILSPSHGAASEDVASWTAGQFEQLPTDIHPSVALASDPDHPEYQHISIKGEPFDTGRWQEDEEYREHYLLESVPSRCYECAQPGEGVNQLVVFGPQWIELEQGEPVTIRVQGEPGMPVSATSLDGANFSNYLTAQTVMTDATGMAEFEVVAGPGVVEACRLLFASPVCVGPAAEVTLYIHMPVE